jgi:hypothetical protein
MDNNLKLRDGSEWENLGYIEGVAVLESEDAGEIVYSPTYSVSLATLDEEQYVAVASINGTKYYPISSPEDVKVDAAGEDITFSSYGKIYTIRAFQDFDGIWASTLKMKVPAESLEERYMTEVTNAFSPNAPADDENLYAAVDENTNEVIHLVYSTNSGMYVRADNGWHALPENDESLDDLEVLEVIPGFIKIYDMAQANEEPLLSDDVTKYQVDFRGAVTASAVEEELNA